MKFKKGNDEVFFDIKISTRKGAIYCVYSKMHGEIAATLKIYGKKIYVVVGQIFGDMHNDVMRKVAAVLEYEITRGVMTPYMVCAVAKSKQKNIARIDNLVVTKMKLDSSVSD